MKDLPDTCLEIENSLPLWVGGDLEPDGQRAVEEHLARCARCSERGAKARRARAALREGLRLEVEGVGAAVDPWPRLRARLRAEGVLSGAAGAPAPVASRRVAERQTERMFPRTPSRWRRVALAGSLAAAVLLGFRLAWNRFPDGTSEGRSPIVSDRQAVAPAGALLPDAGSPATAGGAVIKPAGLRRLSANERRLRDSAQVFGVPDDFMGSQASFERSIDSPPR